METKFNVFEILQIAEKIENNGAKFYVKTAEQFDDPELRDTCYKLARASSRAWDRRFGLGEKRVVSESADEKTPCFAEEGREQSRGLNGSVFSTLAQDIHS